MENKDKNEYYEKMLEKDKKILNKLKFDCLILKMRELELVKL